MKYKLYNGLLFLHSNGLDISIRKVQLNNEFI